MKVLKTIVPILIALSIIVISVNTLAIDDPGYYDPGSINTTDAKITGDIIGKVLGIVKVVGIISSVGVISIIGIKYIIGSVSEKAAFKENLVPYIAGVILLAATTIIPSMIYDMFNK